MCCLLTLYPLLLSQPLSGWKWKYTWLCSTQTSTTPESFDLPCFDRLDFCAQGHHWNWHNNTENQNKLDWKIIQNTLAWYAYHTRNWFCPISTTDRDSQEGFFPQLSYCSHGKHGIMLRALYMHIWYTQYLESIITKMENVVCTFLFWKNLNFQK